MTLQDLDAAFRARVAKDKKLAEIRRKIAAGKATFRDTAAYSERISNLLGETLSGYIEQIPASERAKVCKWLLRNQYADTNETLAAVQRVLDEADGIRLAPQKPSFPAVRVNKVSGALEDVTAAMDVIRRRANAPVANVSKSFHDDYIKRNAEFRSKAGLPCYIVREAASGCCKWCTEIAGRYECNGDLPEDVYRRHDNCSCTTTYENGRMRQDVWSKRQWEAPEPDAGAEPPTFFTEENRPAGFQPKVLTGGEKSGIMTKVQGNFNPVSPSLVVPTLRRESAAWISSLTSEEVWAIQKYTKNDGDSRENRFFARLNAMLRGELPEDATLRYYADQISGALRKNFLQSDILCYRGIDFDAYVGFDAGTIFQEPQFTSTSVTAGGVLKNKPFSIIVQCPAGSPGAYIELLSKYPSQREFLIDANVWYRVVEKKERSIVLEVLRNG